MAQAVHWFMSGLLHVGYVLVAVVAIALFAVIAVAVRPALMLGIILAGFAVGILSLFSPAVRDWFATLGEPDKGVV